MKKTSAALLTQGRDHLIWTAIAIGILFVGTIVEFGFNLSIANRLEVGLGIDAIGFAVLSYSIGQLNFTAAAQQVALTQIGVEVAIEQRDLMRQALELQKQTMANGSNGAVIFSIFTFKSGEDHTKS